MDKGLGSVVKHFPGLEALPLLQAGDVEAQVALTPVWNAQQIAHRENAYTKQGMKILLGKSIYAKGVLTLRRIRQDSPSVLLQSSGPKMSTPWNMTKPQTLGPAERCIQALY